MKKKIVETLLVAAALTLLAGCGKANNTPENVTDNNLTQDTTDNNMQDTTAAEDVTDNGTTNETTDLITGYDNVVMTAGSQEEIYQYMEENIPNATAEEVDHMIGGLLSYSGVPTSIDYARLANHTDYMSDEMRRFVELMKREQELPTVSEDGMSSLTVTELLNRAVEFENLMKDYPQGRTYEHAYNMYEKIMKEAVTGGYDKEANRSNRYLDEKGTLGESYLKEYQDFTTGDYAESKTAAVIKDYVGRYDDTRTMGDEILDYFENFAVKLKEGILGQ